MHRITFKWRGKNHTIEVDEDKSAVAIKVLQTLGYTVDSTTERIYARVTRVYIMKEPNIENIKELEYSRNGK